MHNKEILLDSLIGGVHRVLLIMQAVLLVMMVTGCVTVRVESVPGLKGFSPLTAIEPLKFVVRKFEDPREDNVIIGGAPGPLSSKVEPKAGEIIQNAIAAELARNGHRVLPNQDTEEADVILDGAVADFKVNMWPGIVEDEFEPTVSATITLSDAESMHILLSKKYKGVVERLRCHFCMPGILGQRDIAEEFLARAIRSLVRNVTTDPAFLEALKNLARYHRQDQNALYLRISS